MATETIQAHGIRFTDEDADSVFFGQKRGSDNVIIVHTKSNMIILDQQNIRTLIEHLQKQLDTCNTK